MITIWLCLCDCSRAPPGLWKSCAFFRVPTRYRRIVSTYLTPVVRYRTGNQWKSVSCQHTIHPGPDGCCCFSLAKFKACLVVLQNIENKSKIAKLSGQQVHWFGNGLSCSDEIFIFTLCMDEKRASWFSWGRMFMSGNQHEHPSKPCLHGWKEGILILLRTDVYVR